MIAVLMAIDDQYASPLLVTVGSLLEKLQPGVGLDLYLMSSGLRAETRQKIERAWDDRVRLHWVQADNPKLETMRGLGHLSSAAPNYRLMVGSSLPDHIEKLIYLDADLLIQRDIFEIWQRDMGGKIVLAVQDSYIQGLPAEGYRPYFNSGVMVIDLKAWRAAGIEQCCLTAVSRLQHRTKWLDQHALNQCLAGRWGPLPPAWNKQFSLNLFPDWRCSPYEEIEFREARENPAIIHFCTPTKPWHVYNDHSQSEVAAYRAAMRIAEPGAREPRLPTRAGRFREFFAAPHRRALGTAGAAYRAKRRRHALRALGPVILRLAIRNPWILVSVPISVVSERARLWLRAW